jgi:N-glycosylase/DNA lyase
MSQTFKLTLPTHLDVGLTIQSGQMFRWEREGDAWLLQDGARWYRIVSPLTVLSNASQRDFESLFRLDLDFAKVEAEILKRGPELAPYAPMHRGLRVLEPRDPVEVFFSFLCTANNHLKRIKPMVGKLGQMGDPILGTDLRAFPEPERIAEVPEAELRGQGFGYRGATIPRAARMLAERGGREWLESLKEAPYESAVEELIGFPGVGRKLADCIALFGLHHRQSVPVDTHIWQQLVRLYHPHLQGSTLTENRYRYVADAFRDRFGDLSGQAQQLLFVDNVKIGRKDRAARNKL